MSKEIEILRNRGHHPRRSPNWRWWLAGYLQDNPAFCGPELEDPGVIHAILIQKSYRDHQSPDELAEMLRSGGDYVEAHGFWQEAMIGEFSPTPIPNEKSEFQPVYQKAIERATLEGMVLANAPPDVIGGHVSMTPAAVKRYEELFFDVRSRLNFSAWISNTVVGSLHQVSPFVAIPNLIRAYGYQSRNIEVVRQVAHTFSQAVATRAYDDNDPNRFFDDDRRTTNPLKAAMAARLRPFNRYTYEKIIEVHNDTLEIDNKLKLSAGGQSEDELKESVLMLQAALRSGYGEAPTNFAEQRMLSGPRLVVADDEVG